MWPRVGKTLTADILIHIHHCICAGKIRPRYRHVRFLLVEAARLISQTKLPMSDETAAKLAHKPFQHVELLVEDGESFQNIVKDAPRDTEITQNIDFALLLEGVARKMHEHALNVNMKIKFLKDSQGNRTVPYNLPEIWKKKTRQLSRYGFCEGLGCAHSSL